jgi:hypothetical protein
MLMEVGAMEGALVLIIISVGFLSLVLAFFFLYDRFGPRYHPLELSQDQLNLFQQNRERARVREEARSVIPMGTPLYQQGGLFGGGFRVYGNCVQARFGFPVQRMVPPLHPLGTVRMVLESRFNFIPFDRIHAIYPLEKVKVDGPARRGRPTLYGLQIETHDLLVAVIEFGEEPGKEFQSIQTAMSPAWYRLFRRKYPILGKEVEVDGGEVVIDMYRHRLLRAPEAPEVEGVPSIQGQGPVPLDVPLGDPHSHLPSLMDTMLEVDGTDFSEMDPGETEDVATWFDGILANMGVPTSVGRGPHLTLTTSEKELLDLIVDKVEEGESVLGRDLGHQGLYLRLGVALHGIDLSRSFDVVASAHVFTMEIRHVPDLERSLRFFERALKLNPNNVDTLRNKGLLLEEMGRSGEAEVCFDTIAELEPGGVEAWTQAARKRSALGLHQDAAAVASKAIELDALDRSAWFTMGEALQAMGRHPEALECFDKVIHIDPRYARAWMAKARSQQALGLIEEAETNSKMARELGLED